MQKTCGSDKVWQGTAEPRRDRTEYTSNESKLAMAVHEIHAPQSLGKLYLRTLKGVEELGRPFFYEVVFYSEKRDIDPDEVLGTELSIEVKRDSRQRFFHGVICDFLNVGEFGGYQVYRIELRPSLWLLTQQFDCRIFQEKNVVDIVMEVLKKNNLVEVERSVTANYEKRVYCTQYRESTFDFVSRLMEQEGIYYYFKHEKQKHTMVLIDADSTIAEVAGNKNILYRPPGEATVGEEHISRWKRNYRLRTGKVAITDFDFEKPKTDLLAKNKVDVKHKHGEFERFDFPGKYIKSERGNQLSKVLLQQVRAQHHLTQAHGNHLGLAAGYEFKLQEHPTKEENGEFLITKADINIESGEVEQFGTAENVFEIQMLVFDRKEKFRVEPFTPKPYVMGPQTAIVVGKQGEDIWTDKYGRIKVQFHWDRYGKKDENSSCWIRVSQGWAGNQWGMIHLPRIGQEVIVDFLEGDPDQPIVTGRVYNADCPVPYELPQNQTQSGVKSRTTKDGSNQTFNELRFEDKKEQEQIYFHAEKDFERVVENNDTLKVGFDKKDEGSQTVEIYKDRTHTIETGNDSLTVKKGDMKVKITAGTCTIEAGKEITLKVASSFITIKPDSISLKAPQISVSGTTKTDVTALNTSISSTGTTSIQGPMVKIN